MAYIPTHHSKLVRYRHVVVLISIAFVAAIALPVSAQNIQYTQGSVGSGLENTIQIPLRSYAGRGQASLPIVLNYSSRVWRIGNLNTVNDGSYQTIAEAAFAEHSIAGWNTSLDLPVIEWPKTDETFYYNGKSFCHVCGSNFRQFRVARLFVHMPDGSGHEMRMSDVPYEGPVNMVGTFYAVDGSRLRYDSTGQNTGTLYLPDGTRYKLYGATAQYIDRNGNVLNYDSSTRQWRDTLDRPLGMPLPANPQPQDYPYQMPGFDQINVPIIFRFKTLATALTPNSQGQIPSLQVVASQYLPNPSQLPTGPGGNNYPLTNQSPSLFQQDVDDPEADSPNLTLVVGRNQPGNQPFNPVVLTDIIYPNGLSYQFSYNIYGEIDKVRYPTGAFEQYEYGPMTPIGDVKPPYSQSNRNIVKRQISANGTGNDFVTWNFSGTSQHTVTIAPDGTKTETFRRNEPTPGHPATQGGIVKYWPFGFEDGRQGMVIEERVSSGAGTLLRRKLLDYAQTTAVVPPSIPLLDNTNKSAFRNPRVTREVNLVLDTVGDPLATTVTFDYDLTYQMTTGLDVIATTEFFFASVNSATAQTGAINLMPAGIVASKSETTYLNDPEYQGRNILGLRKTSIMEDSSDRPVTKTEWFYDEPLYSVTAYSDLAGVPYYENPGTTARGNNTTVRRYVDVAMNIYLETHSTFDECGSIILNQDERGNSTQSAYSAVYKHAYLTSTSSAIPDPSGSHGSNAPFTTSLAYDFTTGLKVSDTDENNLTTTFSYKNEQGVNDSMNRLRKVTRADGSWTRYSFSDQLGDLYCLTETQQDASHIAASYAYIDPLGRTSRSFVAEGSNNYLATDSLYDSMGRPFKVSNPYRTTVLNGTADETHTPFWNTSELDSLGRVTSFKSADGLIVATQYEGPYTTVTDQAGKKKRQLVDGLGRTVRIDEPDNTGSLGSFEVPTQPTYYSYNLLDAVVEVSQGEQHRYFRYDALGRMTHERQVEPLATPFSTNDSQSATNPTSNTSWTRRMIYDETLFGVSYKGLLTSSYDARQVLTQLNYDNLNRPISITYSDGVTPRVDQYYDNPAFSVAGDNRPIFNKGHLSESRTAVLGSIPSTSQAYNHDLMGRTIQSQQTVGSNSYVLRYSYNLGGALVSQTYPSGRTVSYAYNDSARLSQVSSGSTTYASQFVYGTNGQLSSLNFGNGTVQSLGYNSRLQTTSIELTQGATQIQRYDYKYGVYNPISATLDETKNNGQIARIESSIGGASQWQQNFTYDDVRRLTSAREKRGDNGQQSYLVNYSYDVYGNRFQSQSQNGGNPFAQVWVDTGQIAAATNRLTAGLDYDNAGNVVQDTKFRSMNFTYDANNRQRTSSNLDGSNIVTSVYGATGERLATMVNGEIQNVSVYDATGALVAEYGTGSSSGGTQYLLTDLQGSPRVVSSATGSTISRHDYLPFGEELSSGVGMRLPAQGYAAPDGVSKRYAGMETDTASGMAHTLWRKYDQRSARWTTTDPYGPSMTVADPQGFNRYSYVNNDPVNQVDPSGLQLSDIGIYQTDNERVARGLNYQCILNLRYSVTSSQQNTQQASQKDGARPQRGQQKKDPNKGKDKDGKNIQKTTDPAPQDSGTTKKAGMVVITGALTLAGIIAAAAITILGPEGVAVEGLALGALGVAPYTGPAVNGAIHDGEDSTKIVEVKHRQKIYFTGQIRGEMKTARESAPPKTFVLVITERTVKIAGPLLEAIDRDGGQVWFYDTRSGAIRNVTRDVLGLVRTPGPWKGSFSGPHHSNPGPQH